MQQRKFSAFRVMYFMKNKSMSHDHDLYFWRTTPLIEITDTFSTPPPPILLQTHFPTPPSFPAQSLTSPFPQEHPKTPKHICLGVAKALLPLFNDKIIQESLLEIYKQKHRNST